MVSLDTVSRKTLQALEPLPFLTDDSMKNINYNDIKSIEVSEENERSDVGGSKSVVSDERASSISQAFKASEQRSKKNYSFKS